ncbi:MAG: DUF4058 family protein [Isosphaeraceae bacterium]
MPSPFPGMNPYLEQEDVWHDFHERFLPTAAEMIGAQVQPDYIVKIDEHNYVHGMPEGPRRLLGRADLGETTREPVASGPSAAIGMIEAPAHVWLPAVDIGSESFIEIRDRRSRELVGVVELLNPANKRPGPDRAQYLAKRGKILKGQARLVEIDLLRAGEPTPWERPACTYSVAVSRSDDGPRAGFWPIGLRDPLPVIPIPLRPPHPDARLDLQALLHQIYDAAGYAYYLYEGAPSPALAPEDAEWARGLIGR